MYRTIITIFLLLSVTALHSQPKITIKEKSLPIFEKIVVSDMLQISVVRGKENSIKVTADDDGHKSLEIKVKSGVLYIYQNGRAQLNFTPSVANIHKAVIDQKIVVTTAQPIERFTLSGNAFVSYTDPNSLKVLGIKADDSSDFEGSLTCQTLSVNLTNNSGADISGIIEKFKITADSSVMRINDVIIQTADITLTGKSRMDASGKTNILMLNVLQQSRFEGIGFESAEAKVDVQNRSDAFFKATKRLILTAKDRAHVVCTGLPEVTKDVSPDCKIKIR
ncbi:MAG: DUF2807 domain-containing protein [Bacteroidales bacterium]|nr:DUF2807 domain-containing protein [Bacteroidales bacterium]